MHNPHATARATPGHISPNPIPTTTLSPAGLKAALAFVDGHLDGLRQAIAPAVASLPDGDHPVIWLSHHLAVAAYEIEECRHVAELLADGKEGQA
jgi:hypothetical protein